MPRTVVCAFCNKKFVTNQALAAFCPNQKCQKERKRRNRMKQPTIPAAIPTVPVVATSDELTHLRAEVPRLREEVRRLLEVQEKLEQKCVLIWGIYRAAAERGDV